MPITLPVAVSTTSPALRPVALDCTGEEGTIPPAQPDNSETAKQIEHNRPVDTREEFAGKRGLMHKQLKVDAITRPPGSKSRLLPSSRFEVELPESILDNKALIE
jgi:hypothetical protein